MRKAKKENAKSALEKSVSSLLSLMGSKAEFEIKEEGENITIDIDAKDETGLLIGRHGETINSIQTILGLIAFQKTGEWKRVLVNVGDWREKQEEKLQELAEQASLRAVETGEPQAIYSLTPGQRRIIHLFLSENKDVETESLGEGEDRYLLVKPKKKISGKDS